MPYSTWRDDSGDEWQQALILHSVSPRPGDLSALVIERTGLAKEDHSVKTSEPNDTQPRGFSVTLATFPTGVDSGQLWEG